MTQKQQAAKRREDSLSRERIVETAIQLLDTNGEAGLTFRSLAERLHTGPGAIYWHIANRSELLTAACDAIVARTISAQENADGPEAAIRSVAVGMFDAMSAHPWVGSALIQSPGQMPMVRILEHIGQQVRALAVPANDQWTAASALLSYIVGVGGQNAANGQLAQARGINRADFMQSISAAWLQLNAEEFVFTRSVAGQLQTHDDRADFLGGVDLILNGLLLTRNK